MKNKLINTAGLSITELLIAIIVISITMLGVFGADHAVRKADLDKTKSYHLAMETQALMQRILDTARLATGTSDDEGILIYSDHISVRQDYDLVSGDYNSTPNDYTDDRWRLLTLIETEFYMCDSDDPADVCTTSDQKIGNTLPDIITADNPLFVIDEANYDMYFEITLASRNDSSAANHNMNNPTYTLTASIQPEVHSF